jgi:hypothetical protein
LPEDEQKKIAALEQELLKQKTKCEAIEKQYVGMIKFLQGAGLDLQNYSRAFEQEYNKIVNPQPQMAPQVMQAAKPNRAERRAKERGVQPQARITKPAT